MKTRVKEALSTLTFSIFFATFSGGVVNSRLHLRQDQQENIELQQVHVSRAYTDTKRTLHKVDSNLFSFVLY